MICFDDALQRVINATSPLRPIERPLAEASGLVLAKSVAACWDMPRCDNSAMDGFAIIGPSTDPASGLQIIGASYAGQPFAREIKPGEAVRITTGAKLPAGANTVVPIEDAEEKDGRIFFTKPPQNGQHVRYRGEEYQTDEILLEEGTKLRAGEIALLASAGVGQVHVYPRLLVAVISTGDELVDIGQTPGPEQIINSNLHFLKTRLEECGCTPVCLGIGADDSQTIGQLIEKALDSDLIITTGGVSVGEKDQVQVALEPYNFKQIFWKVAIKPGKPVLFGKIDETPFFGLPGNPAATAATFELLVKPAIKRLAGCISVLPEKRIATLTHEVLGGRKRLSFLWCSLQWKKNGYEVTVSQRQGSNQNRCLTSKNAILALPENVKVLNSGEQVEVMLTEEP